MTHPQSRDAKPPRLSHAQAPIRTLRFYRTSVPSWGTDDMTPLRELVTTLHQTLRRANLPLRYSRVSPHRPGCGVSLPLRSPGFVLLIWLPLPAPPGVSPSTGRRPQVASGGVVGPASGVDRTRAGWTQRLARPSFRKSPQRLRARKCRGRAEEASTSMGGPRAHAPTNPLHSHSHPDWATAGRDVGLANALAAITAERAPPGTTRQALGPRLRAPGVRRGVLLAVTKAVARSFSQ
jgi:hypothetical protein